MEVIAFSKDQIWVTIKLEKLKPKDSIRTISGGNYDFSNIADSYMIRAKGSRDADYKSIIKVIKDKLREIIGKQPLVIGPSYASGLIDFIFDNVEIDEEGLLTELSKAIESSELRHRSTNIVKNLCSNCNKTYKPSDNYCSNCGKLLSDMVNEEYIDIMNEPMKRVFSRDGVDITLTLEKPTKRSNISTRLISGGNYDFVNKDSIKCILKISTLEKIDYESMVTFAKRELKKITGYEPIFDSSSIKSKSLVFMWYNDISLRPEEILTALSRLIERSDIKGGLFRRCNFAEFHTPKYSNCPVCNNSVNEGDNYCSNCGRNLRV